MAVTLIFAFSACSAKGEKATEPASNAAAVENSTEAQTASEKAEDETQKSKTQEGRILVIYFSSANTTSADVVSSATPEHNGIASTQYIAEYIHGRVSGDIAKITPVKDYPKSYAGTVAAAKKETDGDARPEFTELGVNPEDYDVIFIGYPMWWYTLPMIMYTFFDTYDFGGKTIIPFNTHAGSGDGGTYGVIRKFEPEATVLEGLAISGSKANTSDSVIESWLEGLGY